MLIQAGNGMRLARKTPNCEEKAYGYERELSREGIREFVNIKTVWIRHL